MKLHALLLAPCLLLAAAQEPKILNDHNPEILYTAHLPYTPISPVSGYINLTSSPPGMGVILSLSIPDASRGPFAYHIHTRAVPADGNCAGTGGHFSPTPARKLSCNPNKQAECEAGDLSGKWGAIPGFRGRMEVFTKYTDAAVRLGDLVRRGRSVVVHDREGKRIACASFVAAWKVGEEVVTKTVTTTVTAAAVTEGRMGVFEYASVPRRQRRGVVWRG